MTSAKKSDIEFIRECFKISKRGAGKVSPNPLVGAVIVKNGKIIGRGWHKKYGAPHAEVNAIQNVKENLEGATLYCNLEPCCHMKKQTPPCVPLIIHEKIKRVVISNFDPNIEVNGKGVAKLKKAGIEVIAGILEKEGKELNKFYFKNVQDNNPFVTVKIAQTIDGKISETRKMQTWLTCEESVRFVHKLRSEHDAVLVGVNTIRVDDPLLTVREVKGRNPVRLIVDGNLSIPPKSKVLESENPHNTWIFTSNQVSTRKINSIKKKGVKVYQVIPLKNNRFNLKHMLKILSKQKIISLLVEGGADIFAQFIQNDLFDEIIILQAPRTLSKGINAPNIHEVKNLRLVSGGKLGIDKKMVYRKY
jgi:diaminohydroxyphosphoribosylaminopyrimidine deaminase/5-amino-6-(5-phosphoribosylamino)uracil reductase